MTRFFAGYSLASFTRNDAGILETTTGPGTRFNSTYVPVGIEIPYGGGTARLITSSFSATSTLNLRADIFSSSAGMTANRPLLSLKAGSTEVLRIRAASPAVNNTYYVDQWDGAAYTTPSATFVLDAATRPTVYLKVTGGASGSWEIFANGASVASGSITVAACNSFTSVAFGCPYSLVNVTWSEIMVADYDIKDSHLLAAVINADSTANTGGASGTYTDINETVLNDATAVVVSTSGNKEGHTKAAITVASGFDIKAMVVGVRGRVSGTITDGKTGIRSGGVNYSSGGLSFGASYTPTTYIVENDPSTVSPWTQSGFNAAETYLEAV